MEVFYAEDKRADRLLFQLALEDIPLSIRLEMAEDGKIAMDKLLKDYNPDFILLDVNMPFKNGHECLREIRQNAKFDQTPVIMFTTSAMDKDIENAYAEKANLYIQKPYDINMQAVVMRTIFSMNWKDYFPQPPMEKFVFKLHGSN